MMEKTGSYETTVYKEDGKLMMRLPGVASKTYDNRFGSLSLEEGETKTFPKEDG